jgi:asparagine synthase (glutamine-hydrolysing)
MKKEIDLTSIRNILTIRYNPLEKSLINPVSWKDFDSSKSDELGKKTQNLLLKSTKKQFPDTNEPIVISLSSGIDSSLTLALIRKTFPKKKIIAICGVFEKNNDESKQAKKIASKFDAEFHILKMPSIFVNMPEIISITKKPKWNTYTHLIAKMAKNFGSILATGDGADEIFGGYSFRYSKFLNLSTSSDNWRIKIENYLNCHNRDWVNDQENLFGRSIPFNWNNIYSYFKNFFSNPLEPLHQVMLSDFNGKLLYDFIPTGQSISKHYDIKIKSPFLDNDVIKFGLSLPLKQKFNNKNQKGKIVLRKISKRLSIEHIDEKKGFSPSLLLDWEKNGKKIFEAYLMNKKSYVFKKGLINYDWLIKSYEHLQQDGDIRILNRLISILALEIWYRSIIKNEISSSTKLLE